MDNSYHFHTSYSQNLQGLDFGPIFYNCIFCNSLGERLLITVEENCTIRDLIHLYFTKKGKNNLFFDNIEKTSFIFNAKEINYMNNENKVSSLFGFNLNPTIIVNRLDYDKNKEDIEIIEKKKDAKDIIKDNIYTCVEKVKYKNNLVAVKKIKWNQNYFIIAYFIIVWVKEF